MSPTTRRTDGATLAVISNRVDAILREMTNTLLRSGRSAILTMARDFSCSIVTADDRLLATAEGLPVHIFGSQLQTAAIREVHADIRRGDAFLHNDPYTGNTHAADHTIIVPVFVNGRHVFSAVAKAHQADVGNAYPSTFMPTAADVYEEGAIIFPSVLIQRDYEDIGDVIRMCRTRIRVPDQWYGDYLACLGAARIGERRLVELVETYGAELIDQFIEDWFDYSEMRMRNAIEEIPSGVYSATSIHDPLPGVLPDGVEVFVELHVHQDEGRVEIDLTRNRDCVPAGLNMSEATAINSAVTGLLNTVGADIPHNHGTFRRVQVHLRENCITGIPIHPTCTSVATTNIADRVVNAAQSALAEVGRIGLAEGGAGLGAGYAVIGGHDRRRGGEPYVNQIIAGANGGPASSVSDGWLNFTLPVTGGLMLRDSVEVDEQKYPIMYTSIGLVKDAAGAGEYRGGGTVRVEYGPRFDAMTVNIMAESRFNPPRGAAGGQDGGGSYVALADAHGAETELDSFLQFTVEPGQRLVGIDSSGGGYGDPLRRPTAKVLHDVLEGWVSIDAASELYGVRMTGCVDDDSLAVDEAATSAARSARRAETS